MCLEFSSNEMEENLAVKNNAQPVDSKAMSGRPHPITSKMVHVLSRRNYSRSVPPGTSHLGFGRPSKLWKKYKKDVKKGFY